jgi:hypothetical protein
MGISLGSGDKYVERDADYLKIVSLAGSFTLSLARPMPLGKPSTATIPELDVTVRHGAGCCA